MNLYEFVLYIAYRRFLNESGLILTGGGAVGLFHIGVVHTLVRKGLLPKYITGSSVGSIVAAIVACKSREELQIFLESIVHKPLRFFEEKTWWEAILAWKQRGYLYDGNRLVLLMREIIGDITFAEAYQKTGFILNIPVCSKDSGTCIFLNYQTSPTVLVWSAVAASTSLPLFFPSRYLYHIQNELIQPWTLTEWVDGSLIADIPIDYIRRCYGIKWFLLSQTNPLIVYLLRLKQWLGKHHGPYLEHFFRTNAMKWYEHVPFGFGKTVLSMLQSEWETHFTFVIPIYRVLSLHRAVLNHSHSDWKLAIEEGTTISRQVFHK
jgi:TAG lipase/steryl ester hydrolase/phospholipase A2/LPA acyltransferase